jgi:hypothetical protein
MDRSIEFNLERLIQALVLLIKQQVTDKTNVFVDGCLNPP